MLTSPNMTARAALLPMAWLSSNSMERTMGSLVSMVAISTRRPIFKSRLKNMVLDMMTSLNRSHTSIPKNQS